jgi:hypothetical protein
VNQYSQEGPQWGGGHGVFTYHLLRGLEGAADADGDGIVTLGESLEWTRDRVRRDTRSGQIPSISQTAFDSSWPMSIGDPSLIAAMPEAPADEEPSEGRILAADRSGGPARPRPASQAGAGNGLLVVVYGDGPGASAAEESVLQRLRSRREIRVMDTNSIGITGADHPAVQSAVQGDFLAITELMRDQGGEFVFVGNLETSATPAAGPMFSGRARLELRMYRVSTGELVDSDVFGVGMDGRPAKIGGSELDALTQAAEEAGALAGAAARIWLNRVLR